MSNLIELASLAALFCLIVAGIRYLRRNQPDPNPAIDAREAAKQAAAQAALLSPQAAHLVVAQAALPALAKGDADPEPADLRGQRLPFVGTDRRRSLDNEARAWRNAA